MSVLDALGDYLEEIVYDSVRKAIAEVAPISVQEEKEVYVSVPEGCKFLGVKTTAFYARLKECKSIRTRKEGGRREVCLNDLQRLKEEKAIGKYARYKGK